MNTSKMSHFKNTPNHFKLLAFVILAGILGVVSNHALAGEPVPLDPVLTTVDDGFTSAVAVRNAGDGSDRLFVVEQTGRIKIIKNGSTLATPFLNVDPISNGGGEQGLLGLAFHPNYAVNGFFYIYYNNTSGDSVIARYSVSANDPDVADPDSGITIISIDQDFSNHNGGDIHFSPADGYLYIGLGDGGAGDDPCNRAQTIDPDDINNDGSCAADSNFTGNDNSRALLGAMLRIDVDNPGANVSDACGEGVNYGIPANNPFSDGNNDCGEIWAWGLRNPFRFGFDRDLGDLFIGDVGQDAREEFNFQPATSSGGENYGWVCREGTIATPGINCTVANAVDPFAELSHTNSNACSAIGGFPYRGPDDSWQGVYVYSDVCTQELYYSVQGTGGWSGVSFLIDTNGGVRGFGEDEVGNLFYVTSSDVVQIQDDMIFINGFESSN